MASIKQPNVRSVQHFCIAATQTTTTTTTTRTTNAHTIQTLPERFARHRQQPTNPNHYYPNKLQQQFRPYRQALQHTLHAIVLTLLVLLLSHWIAQASVAAAVATSVRYELPTLTPPPQSNAHDPLLSIDVADDDFNASAFITSAISHTSGMVSLTAVAATATATATASAMAAANMHINATARLNSASSNINNNNNNNHNYSINPRYVSDVGSSSSAALITTSSIWDPIIGAYPTDDTVSIAPPPTLQGSHENDYDEIALPPWHAAIVCIILMLVIIGTVIGNVLVCIAVCMVRKLRRPCNYLLVSLALSDLCVALLVMPMAMLYEVLDKWNFGPILCDIWVSFDVLCCTASILNLCAISVDRYLAITKPLEYGVKRTPRRMMACVALVWLAAASISLPPLLILGNEHEDEHGTPICIVCQNFAYQIYATLGSFYIPLSVMLFVYYQIFRAARRIVLEEKRAQTHLQHALNGTASPQPPPPVNTDLTVVGSGNGQRHSSYGNTSLTYSTCGTLSAHHASGGSGGGVSGSTGLLGSPHQKKLRFQLAKEKKASTTLGIIMSAFTICWLPFFILALIRPFVESETVHVPAALSSLFLWLGYANSLLNPIIYATLNRDFRKPFQLILHLRCSSLNTMMRENYYQDQYGEPPSQRVMLGDERHGARESFL